MLSFLPLFFFLLLHGALAAPSPLGDPVHTPIRVRRATATDRMANMPHIMDAIRDKYGFKPKNQKRSVTSVTITDEGNDFVYTAAVAIGTPPQEFNLILDTGKPFLSFFPITSHLALGSSDLWVATNQCTTCDGIPVFNPSRSSSFKNSSSSLTISYGSGQAFGHVSQDTVSFSGFAMSQALLSVSATTSGLINSQQSGIIGMGFESISSLQTAPFWETLLNQNKLSSPMFSFYLARNNNQNQVAEAPGGIFTLGGTNTSLYSGNIEFIDMPNGTAPSFWLQQIKTVTVQGKSISVSSSEGLAAIDTGTSLIGAPSDITKQIYSNIPGSVAMTGANEGMYAFPCSTSLSISLNFGGTSWSISAADMNLGPVSASTKNRMCGGGIFDVGSSIGGDQGGPSWIVGDTFLKNVYTVFQASPPAVGFAQLASGLNVDATVGSNPFSAPGVPPTPSGSPTGSPFGSPFGFSGAPSRMIISTSSSLVVALLSGILITINL